MRIGLILIIALISFSIPACTEIQQVNSDSNNISNNTAALLPQTITRQIDANIDDSIRYWNGSSWVWQPYSTYHTVGHQTATATKHGIGLRFTNIPISKIAAITEAYIVVISRANSSNNIVRSRISGETNNNAAAFKDLYDFETRYGNRTKTTANWDNIETWNIDTEYKSPNIKSVIQEIISNPNWISGNAMVIFWEDFEGRSDTTGENIDRRSYSYDVNPTKSIRLVISWMEAPTVSNNETKVPEVPKKSITSITEEDKIKDVINKYYSAYNSKSFDECLNYLSSYQISADGEGRIIFYTSSRRTRTGQIDIKIRTISINNRTANASVYESFEKEDAWGTTASIIDIPLVQENGGWKLDFMTPGLRHK